MWIQIEPQHSHQILCNIVPSTWDTMSFVFDNKHQYRKTSTKSPSDLVSFSTMINEPDALIQFIMVTNHHHSSDIVTWKPNNVHLLLASTQQVKPYPFTCQLQWMWHSRNCIGYHIHAFNTSLFMHDELQMQSSTNFFWQQQHPLSSFTNRLLVTQEDPSLAHYSTLLNDALKGSTADITLSPATTFIRLVIS